MFPLLEKNNKQTKQNKIILKTQPNTPKNISNLWIGIVLEISRVSNVYHVKFPIFDHSENTKSRVIQAMYVSKYWIIANFGYVKIHVTKIRHFKLPRQLKSPWKIGSIDRYVASQFRVGEKQVGIDWTP